MEIQYWAITRPFEVGLDCGNPALSRFRPVLVLHGPNTRTDVGPLYGLVMANAFRDDAGPLQAQPWVICSMLQGNNCLWKSSIGPLHTHFKLRLDCGEPALSRFRPAMSPMPIDCASELPDVKWPNNDVLGCHCLPDYRCQC